MSKAPAWPIAKVEWIPHSEIVPNPRNPRQHSAEQIQAIGKLILEFGWTNPILIDKTKMILAGHGRWMAAGALIESGQLETKLLPCIFAKGWTAKKIRAYIIADNRIAEQSDWDIGILGEELSFLGGEGYDLNLIGFNEPEIEGMIGALGEGIDDLTVGVREILETGLVTDTFWISIRGPLKHQAEVLSRMKKAMEEYGDVHVDLGTVGIDGP